MAEKKRGLFVGLIVGLWNLVNFSRRLVFNIIFVFLVIVFFVAFLPQFLDPSRDVASQVAALGLVYIAIAVAVDTCYVLAASAVSSRFMRSAVARRRSGRIAAVTYAALGVAAAASGVKRP